MKRRAFGATGLEVSVVGLGAGALGDVRLGEKQAEALLLGALDLGVRLVDTAPSYGASEERIGRYLGARRDGVVLSTKGGYGVDGVPDWSAEVITRGIEQALARLRTDRLDVFHLHSCPLEVARRDDILGALSRAKAEGKIRVAAYSGENEALAWAAGEETFGSLQCSVSPFDAWSVGAVLPGAAARGKGVLAKRALGNAPWRFGERPDGDYCVTYWDRMRALEVDPSPLGWSEACARFSAHAPGVSAILVGTTRLQHLAEVVAAAEKGPLGEPLARAFRDAFQRVGSSWRGEV